MLNEDLSQDMKNDVARPMVRLVVKLGKLTEQKLVESLKLALSQKKGLHGEMSVKDLIKKDQGAQSVDIETMGLGRFKRIANKYGVDFAVVKSSKLNPPKFTVFFKARDADAIQSIVNEYATLQLKLAKHLKPSILQKLKKFKELVASMAKRVIEKKKEYER